MKRTRNKESISLICPCCSNSFLIREYVHRKRIKQGTKTFYCSFACKVKYSRIDPIVRFWGKVDKSTGEEGCWIWMAGKDLDGYGLFTNGAGRTVRATRFVYELVNGGPLDNKMVCHSCDNPSCVNPKHLWLGTGTDNQQDVSNKNRFGNRPAKHGHANAKSKLMEDQVLKIHERTNSGESTRILAKEYGISCVMIRLIKNKKTWGYLWKS